MGRQRASIGGRPLLGTVSWGLSSGSQPRTADVMMLRSDAAELFPSVGGPVTGDQSGAAPKLPVVLKIEDQEFRDVYILERCASPSPKIACVRIADRRWLWSRAHYRKHFNEPRRVGTQGMSGPNQLGDLVQTLQPRFAFKAWTLNGNKDAPWTASEILEDVAEAIAAFEESEIGVRPNVIVPKVLPDSQEQFPLQGIDLDFSLDACVDRVLAFLPGMAVNVRTDGAIEFYWQTDESEMEEVKRGGPEVMNRGHIEVVDYSRTRPRKIRVFFDVEAELKFVARELASRSSTSAAIGPDDMTCENVLPIPDYALSVGRQTVTSGTYLTMPQAFTAWGSPPLGSAPLDYPKVLAGLVPFNNFWNSFQMLGDPAPDANWAARLGAVQTHFRTTFRINPAWTDRFADLRAYRVATINSETGDRGAASVFSDYCYMHTMRSLRAEQNNNGSTGYVVNVAEFPTGGVISDTTNASPATLSIIDADQGIFHVTYNADKFGLYVTSLPSQIELVGANTSPGTLVAAGQGGPSPFLGRNNRALAFNVMGQFHSPSQLTAQHAMAVIITAVPGSPNSKRALAYVDIYPGDVIAFPGQGACNGPMQEVRIGAAITTARMAWKDSESERIKQVFTQTFRSEPGPNEDYAYADLVVNYRGNVLGGASLLAVAKAEATRIWHAQRDRAIGSASFGQVRDARMRGAISAVEYTLESNGVRTTRYDLPSYVQPVSIERFLPASVVRIWRRIVNPGK